MDPKYPNSLIYGYFGEGYDIKLGLYCLDRNSRLKEIVMLNFHVFTGDPDSYQTV